MRERKLVAMDLEVEPGVSPFQFPESWK